MRIFLFAQVRDAAGVSELELPLSGPVATGDLWERLIGQYPALAAHRASARLARNWQYARADELFAEGDEVALIPPVSGG